MKRRLPRPAAAIAAGIIVAVTFPFLPAVGLHSASPPRPVMQIAPDARLVSNGAGLVLTVYIRCWGFRYASNVYGEATQSRLIDVSHGYGHGREPRCGHRYFERRRVLVTAEDHPFLPGTAIADVSFYVCARHRGCRDVRAVRQVRISPLDLLPIPVPVP